MACRLMSEPCSQALEAFQVQVSAYLLGLFGYCPRMLMPLPALRPQGLTVPFHTCLCPCSSPTKLAQLGPCPSLTPLPLPCNTLKSSSLGTCCSLAWVTPCLSSWPAPAYLSGLGLALTFFRKVPCPRTSHCASPFACHLTSPARMRPRATAVLLGSGLGVHPR